MRITFPFLIQYNEMMMLFENATLAAFTCFVIYSNLWCVCGSCYTAMTVNFALLN